MLQDNEIIKAVSKILQRSEKQIETTKVLSSFVDIGIIPQINNLNNQILYGRRGTGKTHIFQVLKVQMEKEGYVGVYIDARILGSTAQFSDTTVPLRIRCLALFRDILTPIYNRLLEEIIENPSQEAEKALVAADNLLKTITDPVKIYKEKEIERINEAKSNDKVSAQGSINPSKLSVDVGVSHKDEIGHSEKRVFSVTTEDKVIFPQLHHWLSDVLKYSKTRLVILLDEWASLPPDIQPYLAEFIKRGIIPVANAVIKIAALEHRSTFSFKQNGVFLGFELGADIAMSQDLDDSYVFDRNPTQVTNLFSDIIYRHICLELPLEYLKQKHKIKDGETLQSRLFTDKDTFKELSRAAEGVVRDLINIFTIAFFASHRKGRSNIDKKSIIEAARQWFEQDKAQYLDDSMQTTLRRIVDDVIGCRKAKSFMLPRSLEKHPMIQKLFDARVIHHLQRGYADKDNPGVRYNIYTLDYGTYVDLIGTTKEPQIELKEIVAQDEKDFVIPFDDKRSIRRIILKEEILNN